jgi:hypothetical protein
MVAVHGAPRGRKAYIQWGVILTLYTCYRLPRDPGYGSSRNPEVRTGVGFMGGSIGATWLMTSGGGRLDRGH